MRRGTNLEFEWRNSWVMVVAAAAAMSKQLGDRHGCHNAVIALYEFFV